MRSFFQKHSGIFSSIYFLILLCVSSLTVWMTANLYTPHPSDPFQFEGMLQDLELRSYVLSNNPIYESHNTWDYDFDGVESQEEFDYSDYSWDQLDEIFPGLVGYGISDNSISHIIFASTGNWCGSMPEFDQLVRIDSPTGFTRDVTITIVETGETYVSDGWCFMPKSMFGYRIVNLETGEIVDEGTMRARDDSDVRYLARVNYDTSSFYDLYDVEVWIID